MYEALQGNNPHIQDMAIITLKAQRGGDITMLDEVSILDDLYQLTNHGVAAAWAWRYWAHQYGGMDW